MAAGPRADLCTEVLDKDQGIFLSKTIEGYYQATLCPGPQEITDWAEAITANDPSIVFELGRTPSDALAKLTLTMRKPL